MTSDPADRSAARSDLQASEASVKALRETVGQLEHAVGSHADVDQAIGVIVAVGTISPAEAWDVLREVSMRTNTKLRQVADLIVAWGQGGPLPTNIHNEFRRQLHIQASDPSARRQRAPSHRSGCDAQSAGAPRRGRCRAGR
ncbi:ANTAR domain-containing protein [Streptomyces sp. NPDC001661]